MIAVTRDELLRLAAGFDDARAFWKLHPDAVDLDIHHLNLRACASVLISKQTRAGEFVSCRRNHELPSRCCGHDLAAIATRRWDNGHRLRFLQLVLDCIPAASAAESAFWPWPRTPRGTWRRSFASATNRLRQRRRSFCRRCCPRRFSRHCGSSSTPPPASMRSVIFFIQSEPSRQGVHWPQDSWA